MSQQVEVGKPVEPTGLEKYFGIDVRALAVFRVLLGLLLLCDLCCRAWHLEAHYADTGVLPRSYMALDGLNNFPYQMTLYSLSGEPWFVSLVFAAAAVFAVALMIGYRTRTAAVGSWILLLSLHARNIIVLQGGDDLLRCLVFWAMFLPLGACWGVDHALRKNGKPEPRVVCSAATFAILLQLCFMYWFTAILKNHAFWRTEFSAVYYALSMELFTKPLGYHLLEYPGLLRMFTSLTWLLEFYGPFLLFLPVASKQVRTAVVFAFIGLHIGLALTLQLGLFPYICIAAWLLFLPTAFWDWLQGLLAINAEPLTLSVVSGKSARVTQKRRDALSLMREVLFLQQVDIKEVSPEANIARNGKAQWWHVVGADGKPYDLQAGWIALLEHSVTARPLLWLGRCVPGVISAMVRFASTWLNLISRQRWHGTETSQFQLSPFVSVAIYGLLLYVLLLNTERVKQDDPMANVGPWPISSLSRYSGLDQHWSMFSPHPAIWGGWYVFRGTLADGSHVNLWNMDAPVEQKPALVSDMFSNQRWRKCMLNLHERQIALHQAGVCDYLRRRWDAAHPDSPPVRSVELIFKGQRTPPPGSHETSELQSFEVARFDYR